MSDAPYFLNLYDPIRNLSFVKIKHRRKRIFSSHESLKYGFVRTQIMPVRTTPFQEFITHIYEQLKDGEVIRSAELQEKYAKSKREVDVLVKKIVLGKEINIAIECRERDEEQKSFNRKQSIEWVDGLIGKYIDLADVDEVIAVSKSGFSQPAKDKGKAHNIKTLTLDEANEIDWNSKIWDLAVGMMTSEDFPIRLGWRTSPPVSYTPTLQIPLFSNNEYIGTLEQIAKICHENNFDQLNQEMKEKGINSGPNSSINIVTPYILPNEIYFLEGERKIVIEEIILEVERKFSDIQKIDSHKYIFDNNIVIEAKVKSEDGQKYQLIATEKKDENPVLKIYPVEDILKTKKN